MKLIIEKEEHDKVFVYIETNRQHRRIELTKKRMPHGKKIRQKEAINILAEECDLNRNDHLQKDFYMVFDIKE